MKFLTTFILVTCLFASSYAQLLNWSFAGQPGNQGTQNSSTSATGIGVGVLSRGSGITATGAANSMSSNAWFESNNDIDDVTEQQSENDFYQFTLPILAGYTADITDIVITLAASGTGPPDATLRSDQDSYSSDLGTVTGIPAAPSSATLTASINQTGIAAGTITYRLYGTRSTTGGQAGGTLRITALTINGTTTTLPVELTAFKVMARNNSSEIYWQTASEINNSHFSIERSTDGKSYREIGTVQGKGTSTSFNDYNFTDKTPVPGINYYRLKQVDFDGNFEYSKVVSVRFGETEGQAMLYPTLATNEVQLRFPAATEAEGTVLVYEQSGKLVKSLAFDTDTTEFPIATSELSSGHYFVKLQTGQFLQTLRFVKQ